MPSTTMPHYMLPTISSQASARAATHAVVARSTKVPRQVSRPAKPVSCPSPGLPSAATQTTFSARQRVAATPKPAVPAAVPRRPFVTAPNRPVVSNLTPADRIRINKLIPAIEEDFARVREEHCGEIRRTCEHKVLFGSFDSDSDLDLSFYSPSESGLARILDDFSDDAFNNDVTGDDDRVFFNDDTVIHHRIASSAYPHFADFDASELEEEDVSMAALEELSFVEVSPFVDTNLPVVPSPSHSLTPNLPVVPLSHSLATNIEDDLVSALGQMNLVDPVIGEGSDFLFSPIHSSFLSRHPSFLEDS
ncbi:hypothetical protein KCU91_g3982, partial [Aureobasidium melanogenum]